MSTPLQLLPQHSGPNLADIKPLLKLGEGDKTPSSSLTDAIKERFSHYLKQEESTWKELINAGEEVANFMAGKQFLMPSPYSTGPRWLAYPIVGGGTPTERRALSMMQYHTSGNLEKWLNSNPDVRVRPGIESDDAHEAADGANVVVNHYESKFFSQRNSIAECLEGLTFGSYIWRLRIDPSLKSITAYRQIFENREVKIGKGWGKCGDCGNEGNASDFTAVEGEGIYTCPKCHAEALVIPPASDVMPSLVDQQPVEMGDFRLDLQSLGQCRWDLKYHMDESPWAIIRKRSSEGELRQIVGNVKFPSGGNSSDAGLDAIDRLAYSGQARAGHSQNSTKKTLYKDPVTVEEFWMSPAEYGDITLSQSAETVSGEDIPKNVRLGELTKGKSICVLGINEMSTILGIFVEDHRDYVVQGKWYAKTGTGAGRGLQDLTEVQKVFNSDHQQSHTYLRSTATPAMLVASDVLGEEGKSRYIGTPSTNIPISMAALAEGVGLEGLVKPAFQPGTVAPQFFEFTYNRLSEYAQFASHFMPFTGGLPGVDNKTATGANITQAATNALYTPVLSVKGEIRRLIAEKLIKLYPKHFPVERYFPLGGKFQQHSGKFLKGTSLDTELLFEVVADSWNPRNSYIKRQDYAGFFQMVGGPEGWLAFKQADPDRCADIERTFDLEAQSETKNVAESLCFRRVRQMQAAAGVVQDPMTLVGVQPDVQVGPDGQPLPSGQLVITGQGAIQPPVSQAEPAHGMKRKWLMEWLDSDDGLQAPMHLRAAVELLIQLHTQLDGQQGSILATQQGEIQVAGQQPQIVAQQQAAEAQAQQQIGMQEKQLELGAKEALGQQMIADAEIENEATRETVKNDALAEKLAMKQEDREHQLAVQGARAQ